MENIKERHYTTIDQSDFVSRDLSWLKFNERVLDQANNSDRNLFDRLKFLAITASNLDEFFTIRLGSLYNYLDYGKQRIDYSGLRERPFRKTLLIATHAFVKAQNALYEQQLAPCFDAAGFRIVTLDDLEDDELEIAKNYFNRTIYPMLTPMVYDSHHTFPNLLSKVLILGVVARNPVAVTDDEQKKLSFVQIPQNLPRFMQFEREEEDQVLFLPIESIIKNEIGRLFRNMEILSVDVLRIIRNGDFTIEESDDIEADFLDELKQKIKNRRLGRVVRLETEQGYSPLMMELLLKRLDIDILNVFVTNNILDYTCLWSIVKHPEFKNKQGIIHQPVLPFNIKGDFSDIFGILKQRDVLLHHPYNNFDAVLSLLEQSAEDPNVLAIKLTIYRLAKNSRVTNALLKAAENGKHVSVLFEVKARFDEENNIREAQRLQKAGCFVIYGISRFKTHTKLLLIVRNEGDQVVRYAHLSSGNYNEDTAKLYTDIGLLTTDEAYTNDISEFFNVITGHSLPTSYQNLITSPVGMRHELIRLIRQEAINAQQGITSGICIKINSLEDYAIINELYKASQANVPIRLIVRGICCLRPQRKELSENITVRSVVGDLLEHTRLYYFHNNNDPKVYGGSADVMVRSFDRRIESLFLLMDSFVRQQVIHILEQNLADNTNAYEMQENGKYLKIVADAPVVNIHKIFYEVSEADVAKARLF